MSGSDRYIDGLAAALIFLGVIAFKSLIVGAILLVPYIIYLIIRAISDRQKEKEGLRQYEERMRRRKMEEENNIDEQ